MYSNYYIPIIFSKLFWSDWNRKTPKIEASNMDGTGREILVNEDLGLPNGLTLDHINKKLCWADAGINSSITILGMLCSVRYS